MQDDVIASSDSNIDNENTIEADIVSFIEFSDEFGGIPSSTFEAAVSEVFDILHENRNKNLIGKLRSGGL